MAGTTLTWMESGIVEVVVGCGAWEVAAGDDGTQTDQVRFSIISTWLTSLCMLLVVCFIFLALFDFGRKDTGVKLICLLTFMQN